MSIEFDATLIASKRAFPDAFPEDSTGNLDERLRAIQTTADAIKVYKLAMSIRYVSDMHKLPVGTAIRDLDGDVMGIDWDYTEDGQPIFPLKAYYAGQEGGLRFSELKYPVRILDIPYDND